MTWPFSAREQSVQDVLSGRIRASTSGQVVSRRDALRHSAVWAALRLRADLVSSMPLDVFRRANGVAFEVPKPPVMITPGGEKVGWKEHVYSSQVDLDSLGNSFGIITSTDGQGLPRQIELVPASDCVVACRNGKWTLRVNGETHDWAHVWHEKQYTVAGSPVGLSPIAYAAMTINSALSAQEFARQWFDGNATPSAHFKNTARTLKPADSRRIQRWFKSAVKAGEPLVTGRDWEYSMMGAKASEAQFIEQQHASIPDIARFLGVPADVIDGAIAGQSVTYANIGQRNLQLLIMHMGPVFGRREDAWNRGLLPAGRFCKLNAAALLRMDTKTRMETHGVAIENRIYPPSRALAMEDMPPLTPEEEAEFARLFPNKLPTPLSVPTQGGTA